jgi:ABC-type branched-subunit amino acid transport system substrate-binding protein
MNKKVKVTVLVAALLIAAAVVAYFALPGLRSSKAGPKIAMNLALTGPVAAASGEYPTAFRMGLDEAGARLGVDVSRFNLNISDNKGTAKDAITGFQQQKAAGFDAYISGLSYASVAIAPELDEGTVPHLMLAFDSFITEKGNNRFRILPNYKIQGPKFAEYVALRKAKRVYIFTSDNSFVGEEFSNFVEPALRSSGVEFSRESFAISTSDYRTLALKAIEFKPDLILIDCLSFQMLPLIQSLRTGGYKIDGNVLGSMDFIFLLYGSGGIPEDVRGVTFISPLFEIPGGVPGADEWRKRYLARGGKEPNFIQAYAYDTAQILVESYKRFGNLHPESLDKVFPYDGICGKLSLDKHRDLVSDLGFAKISLTGTREKY